MTTVRRRVTALAALVALVTAPVGVGAATPAAAHTELVTSSPSNGQLLTKSPKQAKLKFSEKVTPKTKAIVLRTSSGKKVATGAAYRSGKSVIVPIEKSLANGTYVLTYSVTSADKHSVKGTVAFRVKK